MLKIQLKSILEKIVDSIIFIQVPLVYRPENGFLGGQILDQLFIEIFRALKIR